MRILYFDGQAGVAGDMVLGALIDLGIDPAAMSETLHPITPVEFTITTESVSICGLAATRVRVDVGEEKAHRHLSEIEGLLERGSLSASVRERARNIYRRLADAEAQIHSSTREKVHFHEVGATDAIVDIVGSVWGIEQLGIERVYCAPPVLGSGVGTSAHGPIIYPAPAALEILRGYPVRFESDLGETTTPTGAAVLAEIAEFVDDMPVVPEKVGYGAGHKTFDDRPNLLRATLGTLAVTFDTDRIWLGASDIDNTRPEVFDWLAVRLRDAGAIDVMFTSVSMKKGRPGTRVEILAPEDKRHVMTEIVLRETGSLGVRWNPVERLKLPRRIETVATPWGEIRIKVATLGDGERGIPEHDDCVRVAQQHNVPLQYVIATATRLFDQLSESRTNTNEG